MLGTNNPSGRASTHLDRLYAIQLGYSRDSDITHSQLIVIQMGGDKQHNNQRGLWGFCTGCTKNRQPHTDTQRTARNSDTKAKLAGRHHTHTQGLMGSARLTTAA